MNKHAHWLAAATLLMAACYPSHYRDARGQPDASLAKIRVHPNLRIATINGETPPDLAAAILPRKWDDFYIEPGTYDVALRYFRREARFDYTSKRTRAVRLELQPGQIVTLCPGVEYNSLGRIMAWKPHAAEFPDFDPDRRWWQARHARPKTPDACR